MPLTADDVKIKRTYWGTGIADDIEQGAQNLMIGAATKVQEMAQDQEGIVDDALRLVGGGIKNVQAAAADQEGWGDDALRLMGGGVSNTLKVLGIAGEVGGWAGGKIAGAVGVDPRIGGAIGNVAGDAIGFGGAFKALKIGSKIPGAVLNPTTGIGPRVRGLKALVKTGKVTDVGPGYDPLMKSAQKIGEILPHKSLREAGGVGARNLHQAETVQKLITKKITAAMDEAPNVVKEMFQEIWPNVDPSTLTTLEMKKKLAKALGSKTKAQGIATKDLDRGLAEILTGRPEFLDDIGVIEEVIQNPKVLEPKNISKWLGAIDSRVSSTKSGVALHHTHLTSPKDLLDPSNVSDSWRKKFLQIAREKITPGAEGIVKQDALAHKPFSSPKVKGKTDSSKWNVKGVLGEVLDEFTDLPKSTTGDIVVSKEIGKLGNYSKGLEGQLQKVIRSINEKAAHAPWSRGTTGYTLDKRLGKFAPEDAFKVSEYIFDIERMISNQGIEVTHKLNNWKKAISKGKFGDPPNLEKALATLQRNIDNIHIDTNRVKAMEDAYQRRLEALLKAGPKGLKELETSPLIGPKLPTIKRQRLRKAKIGS